MALSMTAVIVLLDQGWVQALVRLVLGLAGRLFAPT